VFVTAMRYQYVQGSRRLMPSRSGATNDIGEYRIYGLSPGQYFVSATLRTVMMNGAGADPGDRSGYAPTFYPGTGSVSEAQRLTVGSGQTMTGINLTLLPVQTARISGTALGQDGKPILNAMVVISPRGGLPGLSNFVGPSRPDGTFSIGGVAPGEYSIRLNVPTGESAETTVTVSGADVTGIDLIAAKPSTIRGRIVFTDSATSAAPPKPTAIDTGAWREWGTGQQVRSQAKIQDDGTFEISLAAGRVQVRAAPTGGNASTPAWRLNRVILGDLDVGDAGLEVPPNATVDNVIVEMTNHNSNVSGRVSDADGNLVRDAFVIVFAQDPVHWTVQTRYLSAVRPGVDDLYHARLLAGDYYAVAMSDVEANAWTDPEFLAHAREHAVKFSIADAETKRIDLPVTPAPVF
jgi:protocatechuate 3,4-dioxygenase beta subunit